MTEADNQNPEEVRNDHGLAMTGPFTDDGPKATGVGREIGMEASMIVAGIIVPSDGKLSEPQKQEIRQLAKAHLAKYQITKASLSLQTNIPTSTLSEVLNGSYPKVSDTPRLLKINAWLDTDERRRRARPRPNGFHTTSVFRAIDGLAKLAKTSARTPGIKQDGAVQQESSTIAIGFGPAGCGKSIGAAALNHADSTSILIRIQQGSKGTDAGLARLILAAGGWRSAPPSKSLIDFIIDKLKDTGRLLIIDEGHRLVFSGCELLRDLADVCGIPILILATSQFYERVTKVQTRSGYLNYDQFTSRVCASCELIKGLDGEGGKSRPIYDTKEIAAIFSSKKLRIAPDAIQYLQAVSCTIGIGMLRRARNIFNLSLLSSKVRAKGMIEESLLRECAQMCLETAGSLDHGVLTQIDQTLKTNRAMRPKAMQA